MVIVALTPDPINAGSPQFERSHRAPNGTLTARLQFINLRSPPPTASPADRTAAGRIYAQGRVDLPDPSGTSFNPAVSANTAIEAATRARREIRVGTQTLRKRKAAGWGPGGSRTSAIVSGGWECDRRR
jgi:hypothetical protein